MSVPVETALAEIAERWVKEADLLDLDPVAHPDDARELTAKAHVYRLCAADLDTALASLHARSPETTGERWYVPCGCDHHGDHLGCDKSCKDEGCQHPVGMDVSVATEQAADAHVHGPECWKPSPVRSPDGLTEALLETRRRLWWFIQQDSGDGNELDASEVCAEAMDIQHHVIDPALAAAGQPATKETGEE